MELQLNKKDLTCMQLKVRQNVNRQDARMIRLGFRKLLTQARNTFLMDFTEAVVEKDAITALLELQLEAITGKIRLVMFGKDPQFCQATNFNDAKALTSSMIKLDKVLHPQLVQLYKALEERLGKAEAIMNGEDENLRWTEIYDLNVELNGTAKFWEVRVKDLLDEHVVAEDLESLVEDKKQMTERVVTRLEGVGKKI